MHPDRRAALLALCRAGQIEAAIDDARKDYPAMDRDELRAALLEALERDRRDREAR